MLDVARGAIRRALAGQDVPEPQSDDAALTQPAGCFVSLHDFHGKLRGCIGRIDESEPLIRAVTAAAVSVLKDPRFSGEPVTNAELGRLEIELSILSPRQPVKNVLVFDPMND